MEISYLGHASFKIVSQKTTLVTDPFDPKIGIPFPKIKAEVVTVSHAHFDHSYTQGITGEPFLISAPGEYEVSGIDIVGMPTFHDLDSGKERGSNVIYQISTEDLNLLHCGDLGDELGHEVLDELAEIDVLMVPVGGYYTIGPKEAVNLITAIEPHYVLPMHYQTPEHDQAAFSKVKPLAAFLEEMGIEGERLPSLKLSKANLPEETKIILLERI